MGEDVMDEWRSAWRSIHHEQDGTSHSCAWSDYMLLHRMLHLLLHHLLLLPQLQMFRVQALCVWHPSEAETLQQRGTEVRVFRHAKQTQQQRMAILQPRERLDRLF